MAASVFASQHLARLFPTGDVARLFSDSAEIRAMMLVEGALAKVQGAAGVIPELSATAIHRASLELQVDPAALATETGRNGVVVPALVAAFRAEMKAPEHAQFVHWGATSQDIVDSALMLRLKQVIAQWEVRLGTILARLATLADTHAATPMAARTFGQTAVPTSFGATAAGWGWPLLDARAEAADLRTALPVSLSGAAGTASELGPDPAALRAALAEALGLADPGRGWHTDRGVILRLAGWATRVAAALGKIGGDLVLAAQSGLSEVDLGTAGASSTMPQKHNPVGPSVLVALQAQVAAQAGLLQATGAHRQARDGAAWFTEWLALPPLCLGLTAGLETARTLLDGLAPDRAAMLRGIEGAQGTLSAEALSFALTDRMSRPEAQAAVKALCHRAAETGTHLRDAALAEWPDLDPALFAPDGRLGTAPDEARAFARAVRAAG